MQGVIMETGVFRAYRQRTIGFRVKVISRRRFMGRDEYLIRPLAGTGQAWVKSTSVKLDKLDKN